MRYAFDLEGRRYYVQVEEHADGPKFIVDGTPFEPTVETVGKSHYKVNLDGSSFDFRLAAGHIHEGPHTLDVSVQRAKPELVRAGGKGRRGDGRIKPPMPGKIVEVQVKIGDNVVEGSPLLVLEAMKMQNDLKSPIAGVVTQIHVKPGQNVEAATVMVEIEPVADETA